ncbi:MAG: hypothetical protein ACI9TF_000475 [Paracrocinitomix sp.]|jgi:hypothetical protein
MELTLEDRLDLCEIPGRYGDSIDDRNWDQLRTIFTEDAVFDLTGVGSRVLTGIDDIVAFMEEEAAHPRTHMMTNVYASPTDDGADLRFRIVALLGQGKTGTASYYDKVVKTDAGWRVQHRETTLRRRDKREAVVDRDGIAL